MWHWLTHYKDLITLAISITAMSLTTYTVIQTRRQRRADTFIRLHELLIQPDVQRGRRLLFEAAEGKPMPASGTVEWDEINRSLALYDTLGLYVAHHFVDRETTLDVWHHSLRAIREPAEHFIAQRQSRWRPWPHLSRLFEAAASHRSRLACCSLIPIPEAGRKNDSN
jgi:hypothetical protein